MTIWECKPEDLLGPLNEVERKNAPSQLFVAGDRDVFSRGARVSVVGSRKTTSSALETTVRLSTSLVEMGVVIVSGLAEGIDTAAHLAAMEGGGRTVAVLGTSLDEYYPSGNRELQQQLMRKHTVVSQFAVDMPTTRRNFPMRNRTMALISDATLIVEAGEKSGTQHQGWEALRLGRPLFLMDSLLSGRELEWAVKMMGYGAEVLTLDSLDFMMEFLPERTVGETPRLAV